jgi:hypothetical protein
VVSDGPTDTPGDVAIDAAVDTAIDAAVDAAIDTPDPTFVAYDIGYVNDLTFTTSTTAVSHMLLVINRGSTALQLSTVSVKDVGDDNTSVAWSFAKKTDSTVMLRPGRAAGALSPLARETLVTSGLVPEPIDDQLLDFEMAFAAPAPLGTAVHGQAVITINGVDITVPFVIHVGDQPGLMFNDAKRISVQP